MKIGILLDQILVGGVARYAFEEVKHLREMGQQVELMVLMKKKVQGYQYDDLLRKIPIKFLSERFPFIFRHPLKFPFFRFFSTFHIISPYLVPKIILREDFDVVITHATYTCFTSYRLWKKRNIPYIAYIYDPISYVLPRAYASSFLRFLSPFLLPLARGLDALIVKNALATITCSTVHQKRLATLGNKKIKVLHPGCYSLTEIPKTRGDYILSSTKWNAGKRPEFLLNIVENLRAKRVKLIMAGSWDQPLLHSFSTGIKERKLEGRVEITGALSEEKLNKLYLKARVLVHPIFEAFGMAGLEAAAHGCPSIIPRGSGVTDLFVHGEDGFFPQEGDLRAYTEYIDKLVADERMARRMGYSAWRKAQKYSWKKHAANLIQIIQKALPPI